MKLAIIAPLLLLLAACGGGDPEGSTERVDTPTRAEGV